MNKTDEWVNKLVIVLAKQQRNCRIDVLKVPLLNQNAIYIYTNKKTNKQNISLWYSRINVIYVFIKIK